MEFFQKSEEMGSPQQAFSAMRNHSYYPAHGVAENTPYVCVRIPTGGGKTLMATHALCRIAKEYLHTDSPLCLWLAPSSTIVLQTLKNLCDREHPCRRALAEAFGGNINCIGVSEALRITKADLDGAATVIVCTVQSLRVEKTEGRKIYAENGNLMPHFKSLPKELQEMATTEEDGVVPHSLAKVIKLRRPIVISDEAHNASTSLSYETLARFSPSCIVEWTATPQTERNISKNKYSSNVASQATARELKEAGMIKFPISMEVSDGWQENIREAVAKREKLEESAKKIRKKEYIRPLVLYQAEDRRGAATPENIKAALLALHVPEEQIAVHTGTARELSKQSGIDLMSPDCPLRHIITVRALAEGWDCAFAYVLCTMANLRTSRGVEQILGRVLRQPGASRKSIDELNQCYAFAANSTFADTALALKDALVNKSGFQKMEADDFVQLPPDEMSSLFGGLSPSRNPKSPKIPKLLVPMLMVRESGKLNFLDRAHFLGMKWSIAKQKPDMKKFRAPGIEAVKFNMDINKKGRIEPTDIRYIRKHMALIVADKNWSLESLAAWLDNEIPHPDIIQEQSSPYIWKAVDILAQEYKIEELAAWRYEVKQYIAGNIEKLRRKRAEQGFQQMLDGMHVEEGKLEVSATHAIEFSRENYAAHSVCEFSNIFNKHMFPEVGELKPQGEEFECAKFLDNMKEVETWVRNLDRRNHSFSLPTTTDKFYPDFVCRLKDKRILVVEYKGKDRWSNDDSKEKRAIGKMWAELSGGKCLFVMPEGPDMDAINQCINEDTTRRRKKA